MAKAIDYSKNIPATVGRVEGAPLFYVRGDQVYRQDLLEGEEEYLDPNSEVHVDHAPEGAKQAMIRANKLQAKENGFAINIKQNKNEKKKSKLKS